MKNKLKNIGIALLLLTMVAAVFAAMYFAADQRNSAIMKTANSSDLTSTEKAYIIFGTR